MIELSPMMSVKRNRDSTTSPADGADRPLLALVNVRTAPLLE